MRWTEGNLPNIARLRLAWFLANHLIDGRLRREALNPYGRQSGESAEVIFARVEDLSHADVSEFIRGIPNSDLLAMQNLGKTILCYIREEFGGGPAKRMVVLRDVD